MKNSLRMITLAAAALCVSALNAVSPAAFSADVTTHMDMNGKTMIQHSRIYFGTGKSRIEVISMEQDGRSMPSAGATIIYRKDQNVVWTIMPAQKAYMEMSMNSAASSRAHSQPMNPMALPERKLIGTEEVNGQLADKYEITMPSSSSANTGTTHVWMSKSSGAVIRSEMVSSRGTVVTDYTNVQVGEPPADLFEPPAGYQKMDMGAMMRNAMPKH